MTMITAMMILIFAAAQSHSATVGWAKAEGKKIAFGRSFHDGGRSKLMLSRGAAQASLGRKSKRNSLSTLTYHNAVNRMNCHIGGCSLDPVQRHAFTVWNNGVRVSRAVVFVRATRNPHGDVFKMKVKYLADGYSWKGAGKFKVCEKCSHFAQLVGPVRARDIPRIPPEVLPPAPVPVPPALALMASGLFGLFGLRRFRKPART